MAKWVRDGSAPEKVPVSFVVTKANHPELVDWLWSLPFRKQSEIIRDILNEAAKQAYGKPAPDVTSVEAPATAKPRQLVQAASPAPAALATADERTSKMTEATASILRNMGKDF